MVGYFFKIPHQTLKFNSRYKQLRPVKQISVRILSDKQYSKKLVTHLFLFFLFGPSLSYIRASIASFMMCDSQISDSQISDSDPAVWTFVPGNLDEVLLQLFWLRIWVTLFIRVTHLEHAQIVILKIVAWPPLDINTRELASLKRLESEPRFADTCSIVKIEVLLKINYSMQKLSVCDKIINQNFHSDPVHLPIS